MNPYDAYTSTAKLSMTDRELEAAALTRAAQLLQLCQDGWDRPDRALKLGEAVQFNQKLWSIFQADLARPGNPLPVDLRRDILSLAMFVDRRLLEVLAYPAPEKLAVIIRINLNLAAGLRVQNAPQSGGTASAPARLPVSEEPVWA